MPVLTKYPVANQAAGGVFNGAWTNPGNAHASDNLYATAAPGKNQEFASVWSVPIPAAEVPDGATLNSVRVECEWKVSTTASVATVRSTAFADVAQTTAIGASPGYNDTAEPTADTLRSYTIPATVDQLRDLWVRVQALRGNTTTAVTASLDFVRVVVDYTAPAPKAASGTSVVSTGGTVNATGSRGARGLSSATTRASAQAQGAKSARGASAVTVAGSLVTTGAATSTHSASGSSSVSARGAVDTTGQRGARDVVTAGARGAVTSTGSAGRSGPVSMSTAVTISTAGAAAFAPHEAGGATSITAAVGLKVVGRSPMRTFGPGYVIPSRPGKRWFDR